MIEDYRFGKFTFRGELYTSDVILHGDELKSWRRGIGHAVVP